MKILFSPLAIEYDYRRRLSILLIILSALSGLLFLALLEPAYLTCQGYPLDDAWIHAVYGRELARSGILAYNPGVPATGCTSPLWAICLSIPHMIDRDPDKIVMLTKTLGFLLHVFTAILFYLALGRRASWYAGLLGASWIAFHPELIAASVSGMEIPLATLLAAFLLYTVTESSLAFSISAALACIARPELTVLIPIFPFLTFLFSRKNLIKAMVSGIVGVLFAWGWVIFRHWSLSGRPFPATFYAKVGSGVWPLGKSLFIGFNRLFSEIAIINSSLLIFGPFALAIFFIFNYRGLGKEIFLKRLPGASFLGGIIYCAVSFSLIPPADPQAFYHQRYIFPSIPLIVASIPPLLDLFLSHSHFNQIKIKGIFFLLAILSFLSLGLHLPHRYHRLANDARNIDDVQVAVGRFLARASSKDIAWVVDAGAPRYFGHAFVVDLMGLNNHQLLGVDAQSFLEAHPPSYLEIVPGWNQLDEHSQKTLHYILFQPSTPYTVTSFPLMRYHFLFAGQDDHKGFIIIRGKRFNFKSNSPKLNIK